MAKKMTPGWQLLLGPHTLRSVLSQSPESLRKVWLLASRAEENGGELVSSLRNTGAAFEIVNKAELDKVAGDSPHQGLAAWIEPQNVAAEKALGAFLETLPANPLLLVLDGVQDPHNLGACLRSAEAAGVTAVIIPKDKSAPLTAVARRAAAGAAEVLPIFIVTNLARVLKQLKSAGIWLAGTSDDGTQTIYEADLSGPLALVMGSEGKGLRSLTRSLCDFDLSLPMAGQVSSLNVSVATGVCLFEAVRQRQGAGSA